MADFKLQPPTVELFRSEYAQELESWLRQRFKYLGLTYLALVILDLVWTLFAINYDDVLPARISAVIAVLGAVLSLYVIATSIFLERWEDASRDEVLRVTTKVILILGSVSVIEHLAIAQLSPSVALNFPFLLFIWHFSACLLLPWTPRESLQPFIPLIVVWSIGTLVFELFGSPTATILKVIFTPGVLVPGIAVSVLRLRSHEGEFRTRMFGQHFFSLRRELAQARLIHDNLFPERYEDELVRFEYTYRPMRDLGGDFIHLHRDDQGGMYLTIVDVTGHGLPAALTVNRLYGELERIRAESPDASPGQVISLLNRYVHLTLIRHSIFATCACLHLDPATARLAWASAGHPPLLVRTRLGFIEELHATAVMLGTVKAEDFAHGEQTMTLHRDDTVLIYTDGAYESSDRHGNEFGISRLKDLLRHEPPPRNWSQFIVSIIQKYTVNRQDDDILIASVRYLGTQRSKAEQSSAESQHPAAVGAAADRQPATDGD